MYLRLKKTESRQSLSKRLIISSRIGIRLLPINLFKELIMKKIVNLWLLSCILAFVACGQKAEKQQEVKEDTAAKKMLQGIWLNDDDEDDVAFRVKGDTIYYPDSTSQPVYFYIAGDTLVMKGANMAKYPIVKQAEHIFQFKVQNGDVVKLVKTEDKSYLQQFIHNRASVGAESEYADQT